MARSRDEEELLGVAGDVTEGVWVHDNMASQQIEDFDQFDPVDADENPFMPQITDNDGVPGYRPFVEASNAFDNPDEFGIPDPEVPVVEETPDASVADTRSRGSSNADEHLGDELADRLRQHEEAEVGSDGDDLVRIVRVGQQQKEVLRNEAAWARINPVSATSAMLGNQIEMSTKNPNPVEVAIWSAESPIETLPVTIQFVPTFLPTAKNNAQSIITPYGIINFGTRGIYRAEVDIGMGVQLTLNASEVSLQVALETFGIDITAGLENKCNVAGMLSFYPAMRTAPVTRTKYIVGFDPGEVAFIDVPAFAKRLTVHRYRDTNVFDSIQMRIFPSNLAGAIDGYTLAAGVIQVDPFLLPGASRVIEVSNLAAPGGPGSFVSLIFELGL